MHVDIKDGGSALYAASRRANDDAAIHLDVYVERQNRLEEGEQRR